VLADPNMILYFGPHGGTTGAFSGAGWLWGHHPKEVLIQLEAALTIIIWDALVTAAILYFIKYVLRIKLRLPDEVLVVGDVAIHGEEAFPDSAFLSSVAEAESSPSTEQPHRDKKVSAAAED